MIPENIQTFIEVLRTTTLQQSTMVLQTHDGFCCLGVITDYLDKAGIIEAERYSTGELKGSWLSPEAELWLGFCTDVGTFKKASESFKEAGVKFRTKELEDKAAGISRLTILNDFARFTFKEIADFIEDNWKLLVNDYNIKP